MSYIKPIYIKKYNIYDIFYNETSLIIIQPFKTVDNIFFDNISMEIITDSNIYIYTILCSNQQPIITLVIDDEEIITNVNKYNTFPNEIIMSTIVKNEDKYIIMWINYCMKLGVKRFIIYDNSVNNTLLDILYSYIIQNIVVLIKWGYSYYTYYNMNKKITGQITQQNHSLYVFKSSKYIGLFDIDEYINPQYNYILVDDVFNDIIKEKKINKDLIGGFKIYQKSFYNSTMRNDFLNIYECDNIDLIGREKMFIIPKNVDIVSVHIIIQGKEIYTVTPDIMYFNHYMYLNKLYRNRIIFSPKLKDDSIYYLLKRMNLNINNITDNCYKINNNTLFIILFIYIILNSV